MPEFAQVNPKVVRAKVLPGRQVVSRRGAMLGYTGQVGFHPAHSGQGGGSGGGAGGLLGAAGRGMAGEHVALMAGEGEGEVFYGFHGLEATIIEMDGVRRVSVESARVLAYDATLSSSVEFVGQRGGMRGAVRGAVTGEGMFTTVFTGTGALALLAHGGTFALDVRRDHPVVVDPQAYVASIGDVVLEVSVNVSWRNAVGRGSGEAIQLAATGTGTVLVQASEQKF